MYIFSLFSFYRFYYLQGVSSLRCKDTKIFSHLQIYYIKSSDSEKFVDICKFWKEIYVQNKTDAPERTSVKDEYYVLRRKS